MTTSTPGLDEFLQVRPRLFRIACRIVGNPAEAEELVQEVWLRWQRADRTAVADPAAFLATTVGPWLSEESAVGGVDPQTQVEQQEAFDDAVRLLLERLSPAERATYVLREGFEYPYRQIAETLRIGAPNARQLVKRARDRLSSDRCHPVSPAAHSRLRHALVSASRAGELAGLEQLLTADLAG